MSVAPALRPASSSTRFEMLFEPGKFTVPPAERSAGMSMNGMGNSSGIVGPLMTGAIVDQTGLYFAAFLLAATISAIGALWWWFVIPTVEPVADYH